MGAAFHRPVEMSTSRWRESMDGLRRAEDYLEAAMLCIEGTFSDVTSELGYTIVARSTEVVRGKGAPAPRIIGLGGTWVLPSFPQLWRQEQAARYAARAAAARKRAARSHRSMRRQRGRQWRSGDSPNRRRPAPDS